jgi:imidazolonepropionase-like amidohydrolase
VPGLLIEGATLIDGVSDEPRPNTSVLVEDDRISQVSSADRPVPDGVQVIDGRNRWLMPGLFDMHVHYADWMPELFLNHGVTSIVDLSQHPWIVAQRNGIERGYVPGPRMFISSPILGGWLLWNVARTPVQGSEQARQVARDALQERIDVLKVYTDLTTEELAAIVEEGAASGLPVVGHVSSLDARAAVTHGVTCLAHVSGVAMATIDDPQRRAEMRDATRHGISVDYPIYLMHHAFMNRARFDPLIELMLEREVAIETDLVNTAARWAAPRRAEYLAQDTALFDRRDLQYIPSRFRDRMISRMPWLRMTHQQHEWVQQGYENLMEFINGFHRAGGRILNGTDTCSFVVPGLGSHREMELLVEAGLNPVRAIKASTSAVADYLRKPRLGRINEGAVADLVLLNADPLADIRNSRAIELVLKDGQRVDTGYTPRFQNPIPNPPGFQPPLANPVPHLDSVVPQRLSPDASGETLLTLEGINFTTESFAILDGLELQGTPVQDSCIEGTAYHPHFRRMVVRVPSNRLRFGTRLIYVANPAPEGGISNMGWVYVEPPAGAVWR